MFSVTAPVSVPLRKGARRLRFFFVPTMPGDILWTASIADGAPDADVATARTEIVLEAGDHEHDAEEVDEEED